MGSDPYLVIYNGNNGKWDSMDAFLKYLTFWNPSQTFLLGVLLRSWVSKVGSKKAAVFLGRNHGFPPNGHQLIGLVL